MRPVRVVVPDKLAKNPVQMASSDDQQMVETLHHRGPDASGIWLDLRSGFALGHARLSIIDLSSEGNQPMVSVEFQGAANDAKPG